MDDIRKAADNGEMTGAIFVDLTKAFDTISHAQLLSKLEKYGIRNKEIEWFRNYLFNRIVSTSYNGTLSSPLGISAGVSQGSIIGPLLFILYFNDIMDTIHHCKILKYADDTVIYYHHKELSTINQILCEEMSEWFDSNELLINMKKGKTESLLFGTAQKLSKQDNNLKVQFKNLVVNDTMEYKYLGMNLTPTLTLSSHFDKCYKRASSRLRLVSKIRDHLTVSSAEKLFVSMIIPIMTYCCISNLKYTKSQENKLESLRRRASAIVGKEVKSIRNLQKKRVCEIVRQCLMGDICDEMKEKFTPLEHKYLTRNNNVSLRLPKACTEFYKKSFTFMGAKLFNDLPLKLRSIYRDDSFLGSLRDFFL
jgi:hypothetical protein